MSFQPRSFRLAIASALCAAVLLPAVAHAQRAPKPACGNRLLPLVEGNEWVYEAVTLEADKQEKSALKRAQTPPHVKRYTIKVIGVKTEGQTAEITLKETAEDLYDLTTKITCTRTSMTIDPASFFFMGEPGGGVLMTMDKIERKGESLKFNAAGTKFAGNEWFEEIKADIVRKSVEGTGATLTNGKIDFERKVIVGGKPEDIATAMGQFSAIQVRVELIGSIKVDPQPADKPRESLIPNGTISDMWFAPNVGVVQARNRYAHGYHLTHADLK